jgi:deoxyadenosine/deoxycytidine kinase
MIVVELAGASGVGKSTMSTLVADSLQDILGADAVAALPEKNVPRFRRRWTRLKRWSWIATNPRSLMTAWKTTQACICTANFSGWVRSLSTLGLARRAARQGVQVVLVDQGILRLPVLPEHVEILPRHLLPDLILHLVAEPEVLEKRRFERGKKKCARYVGERRLRNVQKTLARLGKGMSENERRDLVLRYGEKFCDPAFSEEEIRQLLEEGQAIGTTIEKHLEGSGRKTARCHPHVCAKLQVRGIGLIKLDTSLHDLETTVDHCSKAILAALDPVINQGQ